MKLTTFFTLMLAVSMTAIAGNRPAWVDSKPSSIMYYTGVGSALISEGDYQKKSKDIALNDLVSEIQVEIESNSLFQRQEVNFDYSESFKQDIKTKTTADLEGYELVGTWNDGTRYWSYYQLDKDHYAKLMAKRIADATSRAYDYWTKGNTAASQGDLLTAAQLYASGLQTVERYANKSLNYTTPSGKTIDVAIELNNSMSTLFNGVTLKAAPESLSVEPFSATAQQVNVGVFAGSTPVRGMRLAAKFVKGAGDVAITTVTGADGIATMTISNVSSRLPYQEINVKMDLDIMGKFESRYMKALMDKTLATMPSVSLPLVVSQPTLRAVLCTDNYEDNQNLLNAISRYLSQNYFDIVKNEADADVKVDVRASFRVGTRVPGELYDMKEIYTSCNITMTDLNSGAIVTMFGIDDVRSLAPFTSSVKKAHVTASREMFKKLKPVMEREMRKTHFAPRVKETKATSDAESDDASTPDI